MKYLIQIITILFLFFPKFGSSANESSEIPTEARKRLVELSSFLYNSPDSIKPLVFDILKLSNNFNDSINSLKFLAVIHDITAKADSALFYFSKAHKMAVQVNDSVEMGNALMNIGNVHQNLANYDIALDYYLMAADFITPLNSIKNFTALNHNLAAMYTKMSLFQLALERQMANLRWAIQHGDKRNLSLIYIHLCGIYNNLKQVDSALHYMMLADTLINELDDKWLKIPMLINKFDYYMNKKAYGKAKKIMEEKLQLDSIYGSIDEFINTYRNFGELYLALENEEMAKEYFQKAYQLAKEQPHFKHLIFLAHQLGEIEEGKGNYKVANKYFKDITFWRDSLESEDVVNTLISIQGRDNLIQIKEQLADATKEGLVYRERMKLQQYVLVFTSIIVIFLLGFIFYYYRNNQIKSELNNALSSTNSKLEAALNYQIKLMQVLAHDFRAPLSSTIGIIDLIANKSIDEEMTEEFLTSLRIKLQETMGNLEKVLSWIQSKNNNSNNRKVVRIDNVIDEVMSFISLQAESKSIIINKQTTSNFDVFVDKMQLEVILRNILNNAIKFSEPNQAIDIVSGKEGDLNFIKIVDKGKGMSQSQLDGIKELKVITELGTEGEIGSGMGIQLIYDFAQRNEIKVDLQSKEGVGTNFTLYFKVV